MLVQKADIFFLPYPIWYHLKCPERNVSFPALKTPVIQFQLGCMNPGSYL